MQEKGLIIGGNFGEIIARQKSDSHLEIGELLICDNNDSNMLMQVTDVFYGSQISQLNIEKISGMTLENNESIEFINNKERNYSLAKLKPLLAINDREVMSAKKIPLFFGKLRDVKKEDLSFLLNIKNGLSLGNLRSGTKKLDFNISIDGEKMLSHHILITGTTGKGKSVLMKNLIWEITSADYASILVFDPHDEYFGNKEVGLKNYENSEKVIYYSARNVPAGQRSLKLNLKNLRPDHFDFIGLTSPQNQAMHLYYKKFRKEWIKAILTQDLDSNSNEINEMTIAVLRRKLKVLLGLQVIDGEIKCESIFSFTSGETVIPDIINALEELKTVIIDTSAFSGNSELLVASMITSEIFSRYKYHNSKGILDSKPVINIALEEAPRVIGKDILESGPNIFSSIAREGRKFKVGLTAITQLPSLIPKQVLANINTKIILGTEMNTERQAIIESAAQDLSSDSRNIAALDKGEAIVTSSFARFALPIAIPFFDDKIKKIKKIESSFEGVKLS